jgi:hypothetical protein
MWPLKRIGQLLLGWAMWASIGSETLAQVDEPLASVAEIVETARRWQTDEPEYRQAIEPLLSRYCAGCHSGSEAEAGFAVTSFEQLTASHPPDRLLGVASDQPLRRPADQPTGLLWELLTGAAEPRMPPLDEPQPTAEELARIGRWLMVGAAGPSSESVKPTLAETLSPAVHSRLTLEQLPITAVAVATSSGWLAVGRHAHIDVQSIPASPQHLPRAAHAASDWEASSWSTDNSLGLCGAIGKVSQLRFSSDGHWLVAAAGVPGVGGQVLVYQLGPSAQESVATVSPEPTVAWEVHQDALLTASLSPDNQRLVTGSYDGAVEVRRWPDGQLLHRLTGHNGPIYDLDIHPSGWWLATASGDETIKLWDLRSGERLDTFGQPEGEQLSVRFSPDGERLVAGGADRQLRVWDVRRWEPNAHRPLLHACVAHEGQVLAVRFTPDGQQLVTTGSDRRLRLWQAEDLLAVAQSSQLPDQAVATAWLPNQRLIAGDMSGRLHHWPSPRSLSRPAAASDTRYSLDDASRLGGSTASASRGLPAAAARPAARNHRPPTLSTSHWLSQPATTLETAWTVQTPVDVSGQLTARPEAPPADHPVHYYRFWATADQPMVISVLAARAGSRLDSHIEILDQAGAPVVAARLQAVQESYLTFRGKDSSTSDDFRVHRWEEMELDDYLYVGGEVVRLWRYPRGPDSGFRVYPGAGQRHTFFGTTAAAHPLGAAAWIVRPLAADQAPSNSGLPVFEIAYRNDDDPLRRWGRDSRLHFDPPADGWYVVALRDARRQAGDNLPYTLSIRQRRPDFQVSCGQPSLQLAPGRGSEAVIEAVRLDGFQGPIDLRLEGLPEGLLSTPELQIEAGQQQAVVSIFWPPELVELPLPEKTRLHVTAEAWIDGHRRHRSVLGHIELSRAADSHIRIKLVRSDDTSDAPHLEQLRIRPGETISARLIVERGNFEGIVSFGGDDSGRNLPLAVNVDNIGLNGLMLPADQSQREMFLTASPVAKPMRRWFHLRALQDGNPTSRPVLIEVLPIEGR